MTLLTYSPSDVSVTFAGKPIEGFSQDNMVRISRESPNYTSKRGMDGSVCVTQQRYSKWQVKIYLAQSSASNDFLSGVQQLVANNRIPIMEFLPLIIKDNSGNTMFFAKDVWIEQIPEISFNNSLDTREWIFMCNDVNYILGGNDPDLDLVTEAIAAAGAIQQELSVATSYVRSVSSFL